MCTIVKDHIFFVGDRVRVALGQLDSIESVDDFTFHCPRGWSFSMIGTLGAEGTVERSYQDNDTVLVRFDRSIGGQHSYTYSPEQLEIVRVQATTRAEKQLALFDNLLEDETFHDVVFKLSNGELGAHRSILASSSKMFHGMFRAPMREATTGVICVPDVTCETMRVFLRLIYSGRADPQDWQSIERTEIPPLSTLFEILALGQKYEVRAVVEIVLNVLKERILKSISALDRCWCMQRLRPHTLNLTTWHTYGATDLVQKTGKFYHEVELGSGVGLPQIGWVTEAFQRGDVNVTEGVGDDTEGWGADGMRHHKWHNGEAHAQWPRDWKAHDVIGCAIDLDSGNMNFSLNGSWVENASISFEAAGRSFLPAVSMNGRFSVRIYSKTWSFQPPSDSYQAWANNSSASDFEQIFVAAIRRDCGAIRTASVEAASKSRVVRHLYDAEDLDPEVLFELQGLWPPPRTSISEPDSKRTRIYMR